MSCQQTVNRWTIHSPFSLRRILSVWHSGINGINNTLSENLARSGPALSPPFYWCPLTVFAGKPLRVERAAIRAPQYPRQPRSALGRTLRARRLPPTCSRRPSPAAAQRLRHHPRRMHPVLPRRGRGQRAAPPRRRALTAFHPVRSPLVRQTHPRATATSPRIHPISPVSASNPAPLHLHLHQLSPARLGARGGRTRSSVSGQGGRPCDGSVVEPRRLLCVSA